MSAPVRIAAFAAVLAVVFAVAALAGGAIDPEPDGESKAESSGHRAHGADSPPTVAAEPVRGLAVAANGLRIVVDDPELQRGAVERLRFRIVDARGAAVRDFDVEHARRMHVIVVRRDLGGFQHLHPAMAADGSWSTSVRLPKPGSYRLFADFSHRDRATTLATDLRVDGSARLHGLAPARPTVTTSGGYLVRLDPLRIRRGAGSDLRFTITRHGRPVLVEPYLGADGHLVALREGDLAFLHVHPTGGEHDATDHDDAIGFEATFPTAGRFRLFLQFRHQRRVETAAFTQVVR